MHAVFMLYGIKQAVDHLLMDMQAQKFLLKTSKGDHWVQGSLRLLPFGIYEYVFPKESKDLVLTTLNFNNPSYPQYKQIRPILSMIRKALKIKRTPKFDDKHKLLWTKDHVSIIPCATLRYRGREWHP